MTRSLRLIAVLVLLAGLTACPGGSPEPAPTVHPGAYCDKPGQEGVTKTGARMVCRGPGDLRWRQP